MKKYFTTEISIIEGKESYAIYGYETRREAEKVYHQKMAAAKGSDTYDNELVLVTGIDGTIYVDDSYDKEEYAEI